DQRATVSHDDLAAAQPQLTLPPELGHELAMHDQEPARGRPHQRHVAELPAEPRGDTRNAQALAGELLPRLESVPATDLRPAKQRLETEMVHGLPAAGQH